MKYRVLIVEDNPPSRELLSDWLDLEGFEAIAAANLEQAHAAFADAPPDAVLLDVQLGTEDGLSLAKWIRGHQLFRNIPVIAVTAHAMVTDQERVLQVGCNACVSKPVDFQLLRRHLALCFPDPSNVYTG